MIDKENNSSILLSLNLLDIKDNKKYIKTIYSISNNIINNYQIFKLKKCSGGYRTIYKPSNILKNIQRRILTNILEKESISRYAKAYHKGISLIDNARFHVDKKIVLKLDIEEFFDSIDYSYVYKYCFTTYPKEIRTLLTSLCTYLGYLPQGSPTSSYISNLVMKDFDEELGFWCEKNKISYTRYSDDMTFSGDFTPSEVIIKVRKLLHKLNLTLNDKKIRVIKNSKKQYITGIVVNKKISIDKAYKKKIRQEVYYINKYGLNSHLLKLNIKDRISYIKSLYGKILYVNQIEKNNLEFIKYRDILKQYFK